MSLSVCLSVHSHISKTTLRFLYMLSWAMAMTGEYVVYFQFYGWCLVFW